MKLILDFSKTWVNNSPKTCDLLCCATGHTSPPKDHYSMFTFVVVRYYLCFFSALSLGAVTPLSWTSLCISKRSTFVVSTSFFFFFKRTVIKEAISLLPCFCCFCLCRFLFQWRELPLSSSSRTILCSSTRFLVSVQCHWSPCPFNGCPHQPSRQILEVI